jgi:CubicO group peptidase (beta-lactamase class C family)
LASLWACGGGEATSTGGIASQSAASGSGGSGGDANTGGGGAGTGGSGGPKALGEIVKGAVEEHAAPLIAGGSPSASKAPGGIVGVFIRGNTFYYPYGSADEDKQPPTENTIFAIGSLTEVLTTSILGQRPDIFQESVSSHVPAGYQLKPQEQAVTFEQLATFSGGVPADTPPCNQQAFEDFMNQVTPPGGTLPAKTSYSTSSIGFLGQILMNTDGHMTYGPTNTMKWYKMRLLTVLGMDHTSYPPQPDADHPLSAAYTFNASLNEYESTSYAPWCPWGTADGMYSTAADLMNFITASVGVEVVEGKVLPPVLLAAMAETIAPRTNTATGDDKQGFGWTLFPPDPTHQSRIRGKAGGLQGVSAYVAVNPELKYGIVLLLNMQDVPTEKAALDIMADLLPAAAGELN